MIADMYSGILLPSSIILVFVILLITNKRNYKYIEILENIAYIDELTGLPNRKALSNKLNLKDVNYFLMINLAQFKFFNEIESNKKGDEYLQELSKQLLHLVDGKEIEVFRFYGDIFILAIKEPFNNENILNLANNINNLICANSVTKNCTVPVHCNIGILKYTFDEQHSKNTEATVEAVNDITNNLHLAVDIAKSIKATNIHIIKKSEYEKHMQSKILESKITNEIVKKAVIPYYQPKFDSRTNEVIGAETLARWSHTVTGDLYPNQFIPILEKRHEVDLVDLLVLEKACIDLKSWLDNGLVSENFSLSFNFSIITIEKNDIYNWFVSLHNKYNIPYNRLEMEITETVFREDLTQVSKKVSSVSKLGVKISLDDYTTGSANVHQLAKLKIDNIKIDKSILNTGMNSPSKYIFENLLDLCNRFNITMIVEGVETKEQIDFLQQIGIFNVQGYFFAPALSFSKFTDKLSNK